MHEKIGIITDSTCDIPTELVTKLGIKVLPLRILYTSGEYRDGVDITAQEVYDNLETEVPTTSLPNPSDIKNLFHKMKDDGFTHIIVIHLSSELSGTGQIIETIAKDIEGLVIKTVDSKSISMGLGLMVIEAARAIQQQMKFDSLINHVNSLRERLSVFFVLETLEYLKKGGRIGKVSGTIGEMLNIKPIITVNDDGVYTTLAKVRGKKRSFEKILEIAKDHLSKAASQVAVCYGGAQDEALNLVKHVEGISNLKELFFTSVSPVIGVHTGPGTLGFAILSLEEE